MNFALRTALSGCLGPGRVIDCAMTSTDHVRANLEWHLMAGVDETLSDTPLDCFAEAANPTATFQPPIAAATPSSSTVYMADSQRLAGIADAPPSRAPAVVAPPPSADAAVKTAAQLAGGADSVEALRAALESFDGCALMKTATNLVFTDGNPKGRVLLIGEAPGAEEDRQGLPFVGPSGRILDKMLASIGLERGEVAISNTVFWRPPGNRTPTPAEAASCLPFVERLIELVNPDVIVPLGGPAAKSLLGETHGIGKLRGRWFDYSTARLSKPIAATPLFHPAYLLRTPAQKRAAWRDVLMIKGKLAEMDAGGKAE